MRSRVSRFVEYIKKEQEIFTKRLRLSIKRRLARGLTSGQEARFKVRAGIKPFRAIQTSIRSPVVATAAVLIFRISPFVKVLQTYNILPPSMVFVK